MSSSRKSLLNEARKSTFKNERPSVDNRLSSQYKNSSMSCRQNIEYLVPDPTMKMAVKEAVRNTF